MRGYLLSALRCGEVPIDQNRSAIDFAYRLITGQIGVVILTTGVGFRYLVKAIESHLDKQRFLDALSDVITICRGPSQLPRCGSWD